MNDKIRELQEQIKREERNMSSCNHKFGDVKYNPEEYQEQYDSGGSMMGVDYMPNISFRNKTKDRWSKKCIKCGFEQHTYKQKPIISNYEADFG